MFTMTDKLMTVNSDTTVNVPDTPRGRALYTIDYFLNGRPHARDHDSKLCSLERIVAEGRDLRTGEILWQRTASRGRPQGRRHAKSTHANPTPATDGRHLVVSFGSEGLFAYDLDGRRRWKKKLGALSSGWFFDATYEWGFASSPIIHDGRVIVQADIYGGSFLAAWDLETGDEAWRTERDEIPGWSTPTILPGGTSSTTADLLVSDVEMK